MSFQRAQVGRIDEPMNSVVFSEGDTISSLLNKANITLSSSESVRTMSGNAVELNETAEDEETYAVVPNYKNGFN